MESVQHKHQEGKKLLTNTLALGINHMHAQTNNVQNRDLANRLKVGKLPSAFHTTLNIMIAGEPRSTFSLKGKYEHSGFLFFLFYFPKKTGA